MGFPRGLATLLRQQEFSRSQVGKLLANAFCPPVMAVWLTAYYENPHAAWNRFPQFG